MIDYLVVTYPRFRDVFVSGIRSGTTGERIRLRPGTKTIDLGEPRDYKPLKRKVTIQGTTPSNPRMVEFDPA
jgi:hypothetical protein